MLLYDSMCNFNSAEVVMKGSRILCFALCIVVAGAGMAFAMQHEASVEKGKALFNDTSLGTAGNSCGSCHPAGKGLEAVGSKIEWKTPGGTHKTLEDAVNTCIKMALKGKPLKEKSTALRSIVLYIKSLAVEKKPVKKPEAPKKSPVGC